MAVTINGSGPIAGATTVNGLTLPTDSLQPGMVLVNKTDFTAVSSVSINGCFTAAYENYQIFLNVNSASATAASTIFLRLRSSGVDTTGGDYFTHEITTNNVSGPGRGYSAAQTSGYVGYVGNQQGACVFTIYRPAIVDQTFAQGIGQAWASTNNAYETFAVRHTVSNSYDGITLLASSGTYGGTIRVYGMRNS